MMIRAYVGGVPPNVQIAVHPGTVVCEYVEDGRVTNTVIHDQSAVEVIAARKGAEVEWVELGPEPVSAVARAAVNNRAEANGEPNVEETEDLAVQAPEWDSLPVSELKAAAKAEGISGYSKMKKAELVAALEA